MERPGGIDSGEAMRWNAGVEQRRRAYHERRCAEDPIYKRAYERQQEMMQRMQKMTGVAMAQLQNAMGKAENTKCQQATDYMAASEQPQSIKTHEEVMRDRALLLDLREKCASEGGILSAGVLAMLLADPDAEQRLKDLQEERPYAEEIRKADHEFDTELICLSGFEW